jgi:DNA-binding ferritin-like protein (Dps family)
MKNPIEYLVGNLEDKRTWRGIKARLAALPPGYREAAEGVERYIMTFGAVDDGATLLRLFGDLVDLLEQGAGDDIPLRDLVGEDPVDFVETFLDTYRGEARSWVDRERSRLVKTIDDAVTRQAGSGTGEPGEPS